MVKLTMVSAYLDGGTTVYVGDNGKIYYQDFCLGTKTEGKFYNHYPKDVNAEMYPDFDYEVVK